MKLTWIPSTNEQPTIEFGGNYPYKWQRADGFSTIPARAQTTRGPFQVGETLLTTKVSGRTMTIGITVVGNTRREYLEARERLANALSVVPVSHGEQPRLGTLRFERDGLPTLQLMCVPIESPDIQHERGNIAYADIEFYAPQPYWEASVLSSTNLAVALSGTPFEWPLAGLEF